MKIAVTGYEGRIGRELVSRGCVPLVCDITDPRSVSDSIFECKPDVIVNCAGISNVDHAMNNYKEAVTLNVRGFYNVCSEAMLYKGIKVIGISSDHVFSGKLLFPFKYKENTKVNPVNDYGLTKVGMEGVAQIFPNTYVIRTSYIFDRTRLAPAIQSMLVRGYLSYPIDIVRSFISTKCVSTALIRFALHIEEMPNLLHIAGTRAVSHYQFMKDYFEFIGMKSGELVWHKYKEIESMSPRPKRTPLNVNKALKLGFDLHGYQEDF